MLRVPSSSETLCVWLLLIFAGCVFRLGHSKVLAVLLKHLCDQGSLWDRATEDRLCAFGLSARNLDGVLPELRSTSWACERRWI